jgi:hypothetical protein
MVQNLKHSDQFVPDIGLHDVFSWPIPTEGTPGHVGATPSVQFLGNLTEADIETRIGKYSEVDCAQKIHSHCVIAPEASQHFKISQNLESQRVVGQRAVLQRRSRGFAVFFV